MRDDIVGMLKNAIEHGASSARVAQSLINSGYPAKEVQEALSYLNGVMPQPATQNQASPLNSQVPQPINAQQIQIPKAPVYQAPSSPQYIVKPLPSTKTTPSGTGKLILMIFILLVLVGSLISVIVFKDTVLDLIS